MRAILILLCWPLSAHALGLKLSWDQNPPGDNAQYIVYMGLEPEAKGMIIVDQTGTKNVVLFNPAECSLPITIWTPQLCFRVKAKNSKGESDFSEPACIQLTETDFISRGLSCGPQVPLNFHIGG